MLNTGSITNVQPKGMTNKLQDSYKMEYYAAIKNILRNIAWQVKSLLT